MGTPRSYRRLDERSGQVRRGGRMGGQQNPGDRDEQRDDGDEDEGENFQSP